MCIRPQQLFLVLVLATMVLAGCMGNLTSSTGEVDPVDIAPPVSPTEKSDNPEKEFSQTDDRKPVDEQYMAGELWKTMEDSADLLPLDTGETPSAYFERIQSQVVAEAERYILETCLPNLENFQEMYGGTKTGDTFYQDSRIDNLEPAGVFCKDGTRYLVYLLNYSAQLAPGTQLFFAGGMSVDEDGWMDPGPGRVLLLSLENGESIRVSYGDVCDTLPGSYSYDHQDLFQQDLSKMLARQQMEQEDN